MPAPVPAPVALVVQRGPTPRGIPVIWAVPYLVTRERPDHYRVPDTHQMAYTPAWAVISAEPVLVRLAGEAILFSSQNV